MKGKERVRMNRKKEIWTVIGSLTGLFFALALVLLIWKPEAENDDSITEEYAAADTESLEQLFEIMSVAEPAAYYIVEKEGYLVVLEKDRETVFFETNIQFDLLPEELKNKVRNGISFETENELYDFLESYSS